jgi:hypothetical protein
MSTQSDDLNTQEKGITLTFPIIVKALILFVLVNLVFVLVIPADRIERLSLYNKILPGRTRLPYADDPTRSYSISLNSIDAMFASHQIDAGEKPADEFRVLLIGDSSTWGYLLTPQESLSSSINQSDLVLPDGRKVQAYNLAYPVMSLTKDLLILSKAIQYDPDLIIWLVTLESFPYDKQLYPPLIQNNPAAVQNLIKKYNLHMDANDPGFIESSLFARTLIGARKSLADWIRLQLYGVMWAATGIDQDIPSTYKQRLEDLPAEDSFHNLKPPHLTENDLAFDILQAGIEMAGETPLIIVNEPMFISKGKNSDIRYNFYYPRWAYDDFRQFLSQKSAANGWNYLDLWDAVPSTEFTNTAVHLTPLGVKMLADKLDTAILDITRSKP